MNFKDTLKMIRDKIRLEDVVDEYTTPARVNSVQRWYRCPFPDHNDSTPSFLVNVERQSFICFGCNKKGDIFNFVAEMENLSFMDAVKNVAKRAGVTLNYDYNEDIETYKKNDELYKIYLDATVFYHKTLKEDIGKPGRDYIEKRHLTDATVLKFAIGYTPGEYLYLYNHLKELGYDDSIINESGLVSFTDKGKSDFLYDPRVIFPITDEFNRVIAIDGRTVGSSDQKYKNSKESAIFKKSDNLFGLQYARKTNKDYFIMCEGNIDCISLHQAGYDNAIAILGTSLSDTQVNKIKKYVKKVYLALDNDNAGITALKKHAPVLIKNKISVYTIDLSPVKDPDEFINRFGNEEFDRRISIAKDYVVSLVDLLKLQYDTNDAYQYEEYLDSLATALSLYNSDAIRFKYINSVANSLSSSEKEKEVIVNDLSKRIVKILKINVDREVNIPKKEEPKITNNNNENKVNKTEFSFIINLLDGKFKKYLDKIKTELDTDDFNDEEIKYIYNSIINGKTANDILNDVDKTDLNHDKLNKILYYEMNEPAVDSSIDDNEKEEIIKNNLIDFIKKIKINSLENKKKTAGLNELVIIQNNINELIKKKIVL